MSEDQQLIDAYLDGGLSSEEEGHFAEWLAADAEHVRQFVRETHVHRQIREVMLARPYRAYGLSEDDHAARQAKAAPIRWLGSQLKRLLGFRWSPALGGSLAALATCAVAVVAVGFWYFGPTMGEPVLAGIQGTGLSLERAGRSLPALDGTRLQAGDVLRTPDDITAEVSFAPERTLITVQPGTELKVLATMGAKRFALLAGKLEASVARQRPFRPLALETPQAEAQVLGTRFTLTVATNATRLDVTEGEVRFTRTADLRTVRVPAGSYAVAAPNYALAALPRTGGLLHEWWKGVKGDAWFALREDPRFPDHPDGRDVIANFELKVSEASQLGVRLCGYLHPPTTGNYEFWLNYSLPGTSHAEVIMSPNEGPADAVKIAMTGKTGSTQAPPPIPLTAGRRYYIETQVLINTNGAGHLSLEWKRPGGTRELLTGEFLSPAKPDK